MGTTNLFLIIVLPIIAGLALIGSIVSIILCWGYSKCCFKDCGRTRNDVVDDNVHVVHYIPNVVMIQQPGTKQGGVQSGIQGGQSNSKQN